MAVAAAELSYWISNAFSSSASSTNIISAFTDSSNGDHVTFVSPGVLQITKGATGSSLRFTVSDLDMGATDFNVRIFSNRSDVDIYYEEAETTGQTSGIQGGTWNAWTAITIEGQSLFYHDLNNISSRYLFDFDIFLGFPAVNGDVARIYLSPYSASSNLAAIDTFAEMATSQAGQTVTAPLPQATSSELSRWITQAYRATTTDSLTMSVSIGSGVFAAPGAFRVDSLGLLPSGSSGVRILCSGFLMATMTVRLHAHDDKTTKEPVFGMVDPAYQTSITYNVGDTSGLSVTDAGVTGQGFTLSGSHAIDGMTFISKEPSGMWYGNMSAKYLYAIDIIPTSSKALGFHVFLAPYNSGLVNEYRSLCTSSATELCYHPDLGPDILTAPSAITTGFNTNVVTI